MKTTAYNEYLNQTNEYGIVEAVNYPLVFVTGLPGAVPNELVLFESGETGQILSLHNNQVEVLLFSRQPVKVGVSLTRTGKRLAVPLGDTLLGKVINPLGNSLTGEPIKGMTEEREIDVPPPSIKERRRIDRTLLTGVNVVDLLLPLGKGQRELVVGDRKTGKSSFLLTASIQQVSEGAIVVYAAIGKQLSEIKKLKEFFEKEKIADKTVLVATSTNESPTLIYLTPFTAMTVAEYYKDKGFDVLVILDDLSTHAKFYRQIALLARRFPGRESYPGDIFYTHARLLERAGNYYHKEKGTVAITCLPVAETVESNLTNYIVSNLIGITDGHILFDFSIFSQGQRPAVNVPLSVTRVGKQTQDTIRRDLTRMLLAFLAKYEQTENYTHFGAELTGEIKKVISRGKMLQQLYNQGVGEVTPLVIQVLLASLIWENLLTEIQPEDIPVVRAQLTEIHRTDTTLQEQLNSIFKGVTNFKEFGTALKNHPELISYVCKLARN